jgi:copper oxidase (laccase) domain-containing protein
MECADYAALDQVHGSRVISAKDAVHRTEQADGLITDQADLALMIRIADCQPMIIYSPENNHVGLLHVGWKGLVAGAIPEFLKYTHATCNPSTSSGQALQPSHCLVGIGPCLCTTCAEFSNPLLELRGIPEDLVSERNADLRMWAMRQLLACGVRPECIEQMEDCTRCNPEIYWTYRGGDRESVKNGRTNVLACMLKNKHPAHVPTCAPQF